MTYSDQQIIIFIMSGIVIVGGFTCTLIFCISKPKWLAFELEQGNTDIRDNP